MFCYALQQKEVTSYLTADTLSYDLDVYRLHAILFSDGKAAHNRHDLNDSATIQLQARTSHAPTFHLAHPRSGVTISIRKSNSNIEANFLTFQSPRYLPPAKHFTAHKRVFRATKKDIVAASTLNPLSAEYKEHLFYTVCGSRAITPHHSTVVSPAMYLDQHPQSSISRSPRQFDVKIISSAHISQLGFVLSCRKINTHIQLPLTK